MAKNKNKTWTLLEAAAGFVYLTVPLLFVWLFSHNPPFLDWVRMGILVTAGALVLGIGLARKNPRAMTGLILGLALGAPAFYGAWRNPRLDLGLLQALGLMMVPVVAGLIPLEKIRMRLVLQIALACQALYMALQFFVPDMDPLGLAQMQSGQGGGFLGNANLGALVMGLGLLAFKPPWRLDPDSSPWMKRFQWGWLVVMALGLVASGTLWAQLVFVPIAVLAWVKPKGKTFLPAPIYVLVAGLLLVAMVGHPKSVVGDSLLSNSVGQDPFIRGRVALWRMSWNMFGEHMAGGMGTGAFRENMIGQMAQMDPEKIPQGVPDLGQNAHNDIFEFALEYGVVFFLLSLLPWFYVLKAWDRQRPALVFLMLMAMVHFPLHSSAGYWCLGWIGAMAIRENDEPKFESTWPLWKTSLRGMGLAFSFLVLVLVPTRMIAPFFAVERFASIQDIRPHQGEVEAWVDKAPWVTQFHQSLSFVGQIQANEEQFSNHTKAWAKLEPHNPTPLAKLGQFYLAVGDYEKAQKYWRDTFVLNPYNKDVWRYLAVSEAAMGNYDQALEIFENWQTRPMEPREAKAVKQMTSAFQFLKLSEQELKNPKYSESELMELHYRRGEMFYQLNLLPLALSYFQLVPEDHGYWVPAQARVRELKKKLGGVSKGRALRDVGATPTSPGSPPTLGTQNQP